MKHRTLIKGDNFTIFCKELLSIQKEQPKSDLTMCGIGHDGQVNKFFAILEE